MANGHNEKENKEINKLLSWYNMVPNLLWSIINLVPISIFCYTLVNRQTLFVFIIVSFTAILLKKLFLNRIQIAKTTTLYKKMGVHIINKVAQNGSIINGLIRKKHPAYKAISNNRKSIDRLINQTYMFEKFHLILFLFFCFSIVYAVTQGLWPWAIIIFITNIAYNVYPNLLQQYIRLKLLQYRNMSKTRSVMKSTK